MKSKTILEELRLLMDKMWQNIVVESDVEIIINHLKDTNFIWRIDVISSNVLGLARAISLVSWEAIHRVVNHSADCIVKLAKQMVCPSD